MTGCVQQRGEIYYIRIKYQDFTGKQKEKWVSTGLKGRGAKRQAQQMLDQVLKEHAYLEAKDNERSMLFADYLKQWQLSQKDKVAVSTYEGYTTYFDCHLIPYFKEKGMMIQAIKPIDIYQFIEYKLQDGRCDGKGGLSRAVVKKLVGLIRHVLDHAVIMGDIEYNPALRVPIPKDSSELEGEEKIVFLSAEEAQDMLNAFSGHPLEAIVYVTLYYGLRKSEVLGLKWDAIDFENNTISIKHVVVKNRTVVAKDSTKSYSSRRAFEILPEVKDLLLKLKQEEAINRALYGEAYKDSDYVFKQDDGTLYRPDSLTRSFQRVLARHGLKKMRFHDLRHTTASVLFDKGWDINEIKEWLGHADIETTANIYTHISHMKKVALAKNMENTFVLKSEPNEPPTPEMTVDHKSSVLHSDDFLKII